MATKSIAWQAGSGNITLTYNGQSDGTISIQSDANNGGAMSQVITVETVGGAITRNLTINQTACPFPVGDIRNFSYTGSYQEIELPAGQYKLQCWGAQGGSNAAASSYDITAKAGGKGGYSEGIITLSTKTTVRVCIGGQGSSSAGGFNGGGSTTGSASYNASNEQGISRMGGGGGATDIRLSDGSLLSRMIVAGGGAGGSMCFKSVTTQTTTYETIQTWDNPAISYATGSFTDFWLGGAHALLTSGKKYRVVTSGITGYQRIFYLMSNGNYKYYDSTEFTYNPTAYPPGDTGLRVRCTGYSSSYSITIQEVVTSTKTTTSNESQVGGVGGGAQGGAYSSTYAGKQNAAGSGGSFGQGAAQSVTNYRYCSGAGGGGWYGGGGQASNDNITTCKNSGGGSGFVNTAASASNRPSGYTGLQLDSGNTVDGEQTFEAPAGGTETGHSGNGYARITRLPELPYDAEIDYLESTGTQWIDTLINQKETQSYLSVEVDIQVPILESGEHDIAGSGSGTTPTMGYSGANYFTWAKDGTGWLPKSANTDWHNNVYTFYTNGERTFSEDGVIYQINTSNNFTGGAYNTLFLFASSPNRFSLKCRIKSVKIIIDDIVRFNAISVRVGTTGYLYDKISKQLFGNAGTGSFILGSDKV